MRALLTRTYRDPQWTSHPSKRTTPDHHRTAPVTSAQTLLRLQQLPTHVGLKQMMLRNELGVPVLSFHSQLTVWSLNGRITWLLSTDRHAPTESHPAAAPESAARRLFDHPGRPKRRGPEVGEDAPAQTAAPFDSLLPLRRSPGTLLAHGLAQPRTWQKPTLCRPSRILRRSHFPTWEFSATSGEAIPMRFKKTDDRAPALTGNCCLQHRPNCQNLHGLHSAPQKNEAKKKLYRVEEVIPLINLGRTKVYEQIRLGRLKSVTIGRRRLIPAEYLDEFIELLKRESCQPDSD